MAAAPQGTSRSFTVKPQFPPAESAGIPRARRLTLLFCFAAMSFCATSQDLWIWFVVAATAALGFVYLASTDERPSAREVLLLAIVFRLVLLPLMPSLSDDGFRYVWDGILQTEGVNPFAYRPSDAALQSFRGLEVYGQMNSTGYYSVYPPLSQIIFLVSTWISPNDWHLGFLLIKVIVTGLEIGGVFLLSTMVDPKRLVLYAWNPLVIVEIAGQGHGEGLVAALLIATIWAVREKKPAFAAAALTGAVWVKLVPVLLVPFVLRRIGWRYLWIPVALSVILVTPYYEPGVFQHVGESLNLYVQLFEFNAGPYLFLKWLGYKIIGIQGLERVLGPALAAILILLVVRLYFHDRTKELSLASIFAIVWGGYVVLSTTVHPWYLVPLLALTPFMRMGSGTWLWLGATSLATYLFYSDGIYWPFVWIGWTVVALTGAWYWLPRWSVLSRIIDGSLRKRAVEKARRVRPFLPEMTSECQILDLGAGEGYVGEVLKETVGFKDAVSGFEIPGCDVTLCDIRDDNRTELPFTVYDGDRLPFRNRSFDATLLIFVLHHSESPARVIQEARRVTRRRVIIIESVADGMLERVLLRFADRVVNRIRSRGEMIHQEKWLRFRTVDEWITMIERDGGVIQSVRRWGKYHKQALFVIDSEVSGPRREFAVQSVGRGF